MLNAQFARVTRPASLRGASFARLAWQKPGSRVVYCRASSEPADSGALPSTSGTDELPLELQGNWPTVPSLGLDARSQTGTCQGPIAFPPASDQIHCIQKIKMHRKNCLLWLLWASAVASATASCAGLCAGDPAPPTLADAPTQASLRRSNRRREGAARNVSRWANA